MLSSWTDLLTMVVSVMLGLGLIGLFALALAHQPIDPVAARRLVRGLGLIVLSMVIGFAVPTIIEFFSNDQVFIVIEGEDEPHTSLDLSMYAVARTTLGVMHFAGLVLVALAAYQPVASETELVDSH